MSAPSFVRRGRGGLGAGYGRSSEVSTSKADLLDLGLFGACVSALDLAKIHSERQTRNPKHEIRNNIQEIPKKTTRQKTSILSETLGTAFCFLGFVSSFGFRVSDLFDERVHHGYSEETAKEFGQCRSLTAGLR
jgi:hypothetical protein